MPTISKTLYPGSIASFLLLFPFLFSFESYIKLKFSLASYPPFLYWNPCAVVKSFVPSFDPPRTYLGQTVLTTNIPALPGPSSPPFSLIAPLRLSHPGHGRRTERPAKVPFPLKKRGSSNATWTPSLSLFPFRFCSPLSRPPRGKQERRLCSFEFSSHLHCPAFFARVPSAYLFRQGWFKGGRRYKNLFISHSALRFSRSHSRLGSFPLFLVTQFKHVLVGARVVTRGLFFLKRQLLPFLPFLYSVELRMS